MFVQPFNQTIFFAKEKGEKTNYLDKFINLVATSMFVVDIKNQGCQSL